MAGNITKETELFNELIKEELILGRVSEQPIRETAAPICNDCTYLERGCPRRANLLCMSIHRASKESITYRRRSNLIQEGS